MPQKKINRQVYFLFTQAFDSEDVSGANNSWVYDRPPEGYLFQLAKISASVSSQGPYREGILCLFDGHEYTHWNMWPGVESRETLVRTEFNQYQYVHSESLEGWECKEFTIGIRSTNTVNAFKTCIIVWYYLKKASRKELLEYAIKHPVREDTFKRAMRGTTVEPEEA
jgi:hypothetical protein